MLVGDITAIPYYFTYTRSMTLYTACHLLGNGVSDEIDRAVFTGADSPAGRR